MTLSIRLPDRAGAVLVLGALVVLSACGVSQLPGGAASPPPGSVSASQHATTPRVSPPAAVQTLSGAVIEGLRPTCRVLQTTGRRYALTGPLAQHLRQGDKVTLTGVERVDLVNPCGLTVVVVSITAPAPR